MASHSGSAAVRQQIEQLTQVCSGRDLKSRAALVDLVLGKEKDVKYLSQLYDAGCELVAELVSDVEAVEVAAEVAEGALCSPDF